MFNFLKNINILSTIKNFLLKNKLFIIILLSIIVLVFLFFNYDFLNMFIEKNNTDFIDLIKKMAVKNKDNPTLFLDKYNEANTDEERLKLILTNKFYTCVLENNQIIKTKTDLNLHCGHYIKF